MISRPPPRSYSTFHSALITVAIRWFDRLVGVASLVILARLLAPEDYGIVAMASIAIALADTLLGFGVHVALIRNQQADQDYYDSAWTLRLLQTLVSTVLVIAIAPLVADYFEDQRVRPVLQVLAFTMLLGGLRNIGLIDFQKYRQFGAEFRFVFLSRIVGFVVTVIAAIVLRSYWALVIGSVISSAYSAVLSYVMHPMRSRICFTKAKEVFSISQWMLVYNFGAFVSANLHRILVGRWTSTETMGAYTLADQISDMPAVEFLAPLNRALFPSFARLADRPTELKAMFLLAHGVQALLVVPAAVGLALVAPEVVLVLLGANWIAAIPLIQIIAIGKAGVALTSSGRQVLLATGRVRINAVFTWIQATTFAVLALTLFHGSDAEQISYLRLFVGVSGVAVLFVLLFRVLPYLGPLDVLRKSIRPVLAALLMAAVLMNWSFAEDLSNWVVLLSKLAIGAGVYVGAIGLLWVLAGKPSGAEVYVFDKISAVLRVKS